jgi:hypothetical protein
MATTQIELADLRDNILAQSSTGRQKIQDGFFTADATANTGGRAKFANAFVTPTLADLTATWDFSSGVLRAATPSGNSDVATKSYVDSVAGGMTDWKESARVRTTQGLTSEGTGFAYDNDGGTSARGQITWATGPTAIDGVTLANNDRILVANESGGIGANANGIWVRTAQNTWDRAPDADADAEVTGGLAIFVVEGTTYADTGWLLTTDSPITLGGATGTALTFVQFSSAGITVAGLAGAGLVVNGNALDVNVDNSTLEINSDTVRMKDAGTTFAKLATAVSDRLGGYDRREDFLGDGSTVNFDLAVTDAKQTGAGILVYKGGILMKPGGGNDYTLSDGGGAGSVDRITFATAPANPSNISVIYKRTGNAI